MSTLQEPSPDSSETPKPVHTLRVIPAIAIIYYSATGNVHQLAGALGRGAQHAGAEVRLRKVPELAPEDAILANAAWAEHRQATVDVPEASLADLRWADGFAFGTPTRFGTPAAQLKQFIDTTSSLWRNGELAGKAATSFTSSRNAHGGPESTLLSLNNVFYHWGSVIVPPGYTHARVSASGGPIRTPTGINATPARSRASHSTTAANAAWVDHHHRPQTSIQCHFSRA